MLTDASPGRVLRRCVLVFGLASAGTVVLLVALHLAGLRTLGEVVTTSAAVTLGAGVGTALIYLASRALSKRRP